MSEKSERDILLGKNILHNEKGSLSGGFVKIDGETFYKIGGYNEMDPFFITIVSNSDHWMFLSSNGGITAGRKNPDNALFPYYTVDKIQDSGEITGSKSIFLVTRGKNTFLWEPFSDRYTGVYKIQRNLYKSVYGNKIIFEEINHKLMLTFSYCWMNSERFGIIRKSVLTNSGETACRISILDGIQNILPAGLTRTLQLSLSSLVDAYKKNELLLNTKIALFMLSSILVDRAEPSEALTANVVWSEGFTNAKILLSARHIENFRKGYQVKADTDVRADRGAYLINADINLEAGTEKTWYIIADVNKDAGQIASLNHLLKGNDNIAELLKKDVAECTNDLINIIAAADGLQLTEDKLSINRHLSNVFFNVMRGGIFDNNYWISKDDLTDFIKGANSGVYLRRRSFLESIDNHISLQTLLEKAALENDSQLIRLCYEYLPLALSRRHGDPSRPWNIFSIELKKEDGSKSLNYQGNWRDIFQNWEALALSFPSYVESMISKFLNASTADGYNPYRITRGGIDWESPDPHDPWAGIGYWGDHQVIYLLKLLEISKKFHPGRLNKMLSENIFAYADVPYRIKPYKDLVKNPFETIDFDYQADKAALGRVASVGSDGRLIKDSNDEIKLVNFTEKILVSILTKLSNFIPEAGIWMNTQRPEWNDANNALVGFGSSMVTLCYLRRLQYFLRDLFIENPDREFEVSEEVLSFFKSINDTFIQYEPFLGVEFSDKERKSIIDALGTAGSNYREKLYKDGFSEIKNFIAAKELEQFFNLSLKFIDKSIRRNKSSDNLYHSYNLISFKDDGVTIRRLYEMLEGQVAVLASGMLDPGEVNEVLDALKCSAMFRRDQYSYMLYPDRQLPRFTEKNIIPSDSVKKSKLLIELIRNENNSILYKDIEGLFHFNSSFRNASYLKKALDQLEPEYKILQAEKEYIVDLYEKVFDHQSFTGRSGTFYGYEGLGCIYWHMVSKLMLAVCENYFTALKSEAGDDQLGKMVEHYYDVRAGIGLNKEPEVYGAFPTDAYSHTPGNGGAKQPGMTGQVKEDIISRFSELGVIVESGKISFNPGLLRRSEFLRSPDNFHYISSGNVEKIIPLGIDSLAFTICQVPVIYHISSRNFIRITTEEGNSEMEGFTLNAVTCTAIFERKGYVSQLDVYLSPAI
ncbi:MAG: hypothetical protein ABR927_13130 [Bacteroidales bacterium]|jgi:hypothetical protein